MSDPPAIQHLAVEAERDYLLLTEALNGYLKVLETKISKLAAVRNGSDEDRGAMLGYHSGSQIVGVTGEDILRIILPLQEKARRLKAMIESGLRTDTAQADQL